MAQAKLAKKRSASRARAKTPGPYDRGQEEVTGGASGSGITSTEWEADRAAWWKSHWEAIDRSWSSSTPQGPQSRPQIHERFHVHETYDKYDRSADRYTSVKP